MGLFLPIFLVEVYKADEGLKLFKAVRGRKSKNWLNFFYAMVWDQWESTNGQASPFLRLPTCT